MMWTNSPLKACPSAIASRLKHVVKFRGPCFGTRAETVVDRGAARRPRLVKMEDMVTTTF